MCWYSVCNVITPRTSSRAAKRRVMRESGEEGAKCVVEADGSEGNEEEGRKMESAVLGKRIDDRPIRVRDVERLAVRRRDVVDDIL